MNDAAKIGIVAIGRNEGERFKACLKSLIGSSSRIVYVDSGSTDGSVEFAQKHGAAVVELSAEIAFTASRARNAGFGLLREKWPDTEFVMFIDGDCVLSGDFIDAALSKMIAAPRLGIVTGRCRERYPDATIYNRLCEIEWNGPVGEIDACGGIFVVRTRAFEEVDGFNPAIIAAEDDDFCIRVRELGYLIIRIDTDMCFHDADIHRFSQWWRRMVRAGHAYAQLSEIHDGYFAGQRRRAWLWGLILPSLALIGVPFSSGLSLLIFLLYPLSFIRTRQGLIKAGNKNQHATLAAVFLTLSKFPNLKGMIEYRIKKLKSREIGIVEYK
ncbi:glycosyltransferase [Hyphococcus formosus]|uniref:glycosyltransferase n=1 Tax=Hyphococcus formosus TaxID=3143534 RepID=UPI00398BAAF3